MGGNEFFWRQKHNIIHHTYPNIDGMDDDIAKSPLIRQCETQKWYTAHRVQHIYLPLVYAITSIAWTFIMDFVKYFSKDCQGPLFRIWTGKITHFLAEQDFVRGFLHPASGVYSWMESMGYRLSSPCMCVWIYTRHRFSTGACGRATEFDVVSDDLKLIETEWAVHQVKTTANFATHNKVISWFVGGLNFQIEHHLFPRVVMFTYPALSKIVKKVCELHGMPYYQFPTMSSAIASHFRFMKHLGRKPQLILAG
jgi:Fatty acid desaturase